MTVKYDTDAIRRDNALSDYLPLRGVEVKRDGNEWRACCPFHAEKTASFSIYAGKRGTQEFCCFGCGVKGDVIEFVQQWDGETFAGACAILGGERTASNRIPASPSINTVDIYAAWVAKRPPADTPRIKAGERTPPLFNPKRPEKPVTSYNPTLVHPYRLADGTVYGYVLRVDIDSRKLTPCILWCENAETGEAGWCHRPMAQDGRRPYGLEQIGKKPYAQVLIVEGEKCADAGKRVLPRMAVLSWVGGGDAVAKTSWACLRDRDVVIWPDNDEPGEKCAETLAGMAQAAGARSVKVIARPGDERPKGWDIADAEAEGWDGTQCLDWARPRARPWPFVEPEAGIPSPEPEPVSEPPARSEPVTEMRTTETNVVPLPVKKKRPPKDDEQARAAISNGVWRHLILNEDNRPKPKLMNNFVALLTHHEDTAGMLSKNAFTRDVTFTRRPPWEDENGPWTPKKMQDHDVTCAMSWLERAGLTPTHTGTGTAMMAAAEALSTDPVRDYLNGLKWDGVSRVRDGWLTKYLGVKATNTQIERAFGMRWLIAGVARNLSDRPAGEKVDNMLIIEGAQGKMKSSALEILGTMGGERYFTDDIGDIGSKDAVMQLQGNVIVEIAELDALNKADAETIKKWVARKVDAIRLPYGKIVVDMPRRCILAGTVNPAGRGYLKDATGARRFWPVLVQGEIDLVSLERDRDQLWAEAVALYRQGEKWWLQGEENDHASEVQRLRYQDDPWALPIDQFLATMVGDAPVTIARILRVLEVHTSNQRPEHETRIVAHLKSRGYESIRERVDGVPARVYRKRWE